MNEPMPKESKLVVQKSRPLMELMRSDLRLAEFKLLDTYLAKINSRDPERRCVKLEKGEIEQCLGVKRVKADELKERLMNLGGAIRIPDLNSKDGFRLIWLFEEAICKKNEYGQWEVTLECNQKSIQYFFNVENIGYLKYKLQSITALKSRYSYIMFLYLEDNKFRKSWKIDLLELKQILRCDTENTYKSFSRFNDLILKKCQNEIHEKTKCKYQYETVKAGRTVIALIFTIITMPKFIPEEKKPDPKLLTDSEEFLKSACCDEAGNCEFTDTQMHEIILHVGRVPQSKLPQIEVVDTGNGMFQQWHYLAEKYAKLKSITEKTPISHKAAYLIKIIDNDCISE